MLETRSVAIPSGRSPAAIFRPSGSVRERLRRYTPVNMTRKPLIREMVFTLSVVLNPLNRMNEAHSVAVVKVT